VQYESLTKSSKYHFGAMDCDVLDSKMTITKLGIRNI